MLRHGSTLYSCGYDQLLSMDSPFSFMAMTPLVLIWFLFAYWATMIVPFVIHMLDPLVYLWWWFVYGFVCPRDQFFLTFISLSGTSVRAFRSWILFSLSMLSCFLFIMYFNYHLSLYPHTLWGICYIPKWHISTYGHFPMISSHVDTSMTTLHESHWKNT